MGGLGIGAEVPGEIGGEGVVDGADIAVLEGFAWRGCQRHTLFEIGLVTDSDSSAPTSRLGYQDVVLLNAAGDVELERR